VKPASATTETVPGLDAGAVARWRQLARQGSPWLHEEVAERMAQRLQWFRVPPDNGVHWEPVLGGLQAHARLQSQWPQTRWQVWSGERTAPPVAVSAAPGRAWLRLPWRREPPLPALPADGQVGMLWANMWLHHEPQPQALLRRWFALLQTHGLLMFSCLGPDTLRELRQVYEQAGWPPAGHALTDMHDWGDMLVHAGFAEPVMDMERITLTFSSAQAVLDELRTLGRNTHLDRHRALRGRHWRRQLLQALESGLPRDEQGRLMLTFEIIYGHASKPLPRVPMSAEQSVSVADLRTLLREGRR
jgi:malonyl-CoA O-methyltransferase